MKKKFYTTQPTYNPKNRIIHFWVLLLSFFCTFGKLYASTPEVIIPQNQTVHKNNEAIYADKGLFKTAFLSTQITILRVFEKHLDKTIYQNIKETILNKNNAFFPSMAASLIIDKSVNKTNVEPGETFTYTIRYRCASLTDHCTDVVIVDNLPTGMEVAGYTLAGGQVASVSATSTSVTWNLQTPGSAPGQLDAGSSGVVTLTARFPGCDASGTTAGLFTNTATISASNTSSSNNSADITLDSNVPTCPPDPAPSNDFEKNRGNSKTSVNGYHRYAFNFPGTGASYTVTDVMPDGFVVSSIDVEGSNNSTIFGLEIQCASSGTWHTVNTATTGSSFNTPSELPAGATECVNVNHPDFPALTDHYLFNISAVRWTVPAMASPETLPEGVEGYFLDTNPFTAGQLPDFAAITAGSTIENCANSSDTSMGNAGEVCTTFDVVEEITAPKFEKAIAAYPGVAYPSASSLQDQQPATLDNSTSPPQVQGAMDAIWSTSFEAARYYDDYTDPVIVDLLDENQTYDPAYNWYVVTVKDQTSAGVYNALNDPDCQNPTFSVTENWNNTGRTLLKWDFSGCILYAMKFNSDINITYSTTIKPGTTANTVIENMNLALIPEDGNTCECNDQQAPDATNLAYYNESTDQSDIDGDGNTSEILCPSNVASFTMPTVNDVTSSKWVQGSLDGAFSRFPQVGSTTIDGEGVYHLFIENTGNVDFTQFDVVDILPYSGDQGVLPATGARLSDWATQLVSDIVIQRWNESTSTWDAVPSGDLPLGLLYSSSLDPCRFENATTNNADLTADQTAAVGPTGCDANPWSASAAGAVSFGFQYTPTTPFAGGEKLRIVVNFERNGNPPGCDDPACVGDVLNNGAVAWNSFAFASIYSGGRLLDTEPIKVGLQMVDTDNFTSLGNFVWEDRNGDGEQDQFEPGIEGVTVSLYNSTGSTLLATAITDENGFYRFYGLDPSTTFLVRLETPEDFNGGALSNFILTTQNAGTTTDLLDSDAALNGDGYPEITANTGVVTGLENPDDPTEYPSFDFGFYEINKVGDYAWYDLNGFGDQAVDEPAVQGMSVQLWSAGADKQIGGGDDTQVGSTQTTGSDGLYLFDSIPNGTYFIKFDYSTITGVDPQTGMGVVNSSDYIFTGSYLTGNSSTDSDANSATGNTAVFTLDGNVCTLSYDAGLKPAATNPASIKGYVWNDSVKDGIRDVSEDFLPNVQVTLYDNIGFPINQTVTDGGGRYCFTGLTPNETYQVVFFINNGSTFTTQDVGSDLTDSDASPADGSTANVTPTDNQTIDNIDAGLCIPPLIGDRIWKDNDKDDIQDAGEPGIPGVTVKLYDNANVLRGTALTDDEGYYFFGGYENLNMEGIPQVGNASVSYQINDGDDDAEQLYDSGNLSTGAVDLTSSDLELGLESADVKIVGLRFNQIDIPQGATIVSSYIQFSEDDGGAENNPVTYTITGEQIGHAPIFQAIDGNLSSRNMTANSQTWSPPAWSGTSIRGIDQATPSLQLIVQEIVNLNDWAALNSMAFFITGDEEREAESYDGIPAGAAELFITYETTYTTPGSLGATAAYTISVDTAQTTLAPCVLTQPNIGADDADSDAAMLGDSAVIALTTPASGLENLDYDVGFMPFCSLNITSVTAQNCTETSPNNYEAEWQIIIEYAGEYSGDITYQRNSLGTTTFTPTTSPDTLTITGITADGGIYDTLRVYFANDLTCRDSLIIKRPLPCPTTSNFCDLVPNGNMETGSYPGSGTPTAFAGGTRVAFDDQTPDLWSKATAVGDNFWVESSAAYSGNKFLYTFSSGTTAGGTDACNQYDVSGLTGSSCIQICVYSADANADGGSSGLAIEIEEFPSNTFHYTTLEVADNPTWDDNALTSIPWQQYCYTFTTQANTDSGRIWISASTEVGTASTSYVVIDDMSVCECGGTEIQAGTVCSTVSNTQIAGTVFEDWNYDGIMNQSDTVGVQGVQVNLYDDCGSVTAITYTDANGNYIFNGLTNGTTYRVEFLLPESVACWAKPTRAGADNGTTVQFVQPGNCASLGLADPSDYCEENPFIFVPCFVAGDPTSGDPAYDTFDAFVGFEYNSDANSKAGLTNLAYAVDLGTTWGVAYQRKSQAVFTSATLKRHFGFGTIDGANPTTGGIYAIEVDDLNNPNVIKWLDVNTIGINTGADPRDGSAANSLASVPNAPSYDAAAYTQAGKIGIGDIDLQEDSTLWLINLNDRSLYGIQNVNPNTTPAASDVLGPFSLPNTGCGSGEEDVRPWGLKVYKNKVYIGAICTGESSQDSLDLHAYIFEFDPLTNQMSSFFDFDMNYERGTIDVGGSYDTGDWKAWQTTWPDQCKRPEGLPPSSTSCDGRRSNMQPILADIEFDTDGSIIVGIMDRWGLQTQDDHYSPDPTATDTEQYWLFIAPGDILRVCNIDGDYVFEGGAGCDQTPANTNGGTADEYYHGDHGTKNDATVLRETGLGALLYLTGDDEVMMTQWDPYITYNSAGTTTLFNSTGNFNRRQLIYGPTSIGPIPPAPNEGDAAKGVGLGDLEAYCNSAPLEIGNYVWEDTDQDGLQDACEIGINGVTVELLKGATLIASTQTANNGQYYFSDKNAIDANLTWSGTGADTALLANIAYTIRISNAEGGSQQTPLNGFSLTTTDANSNNSDNIDNDANIVSTTNAEITAMTGDYGCADHNFDFGFIPPLPAYLGNFVWIDTDQDGIQDAGEPGVEGVKVILFNTSNMAVDSVLTNSGGYYWMDSIAAGDYYLKFDIPAAWTITAKDQMTNDTIDSDIDPTTMQTDNFTIAAGDSTMTFDAGVYACNYRVFVTGHIDSQIHIYDDNGTLLNTITNAGGALDQPNNMACGPDGNIYISDYGNNRVMRFSPDGTYINDFINDGVNINGAENIAFAPNGEAFVVSWLNQQVNRYDANGNFLNVVADPADGLTEVQHIETDVQGRIYIGIGLDTIKRFWPDGTFIDNFISEIEPGFSVHNGDFKFGPDGNFYVLNRDYENLNVFTPEGVFIERLVDYAEGGLSDPIGFAFAPDGNIYIGDGNSSEVMVFDRTTGAKISDFIPAGANGLNEPFDVKFVPVASCNDCNLPEPNYLLTCDSTGSIEVAYAGLLNNYSGSHTLNVPAGQGNVTRVVVEALYRTHTGDCQPNEVFFAANNGVTIDTCQADSVRVEIPVFNNDYNEYDGKVYRTVFEGNISSVELFSNPTNCEPVAYNLYAFYDAGGEGIGHSLGVIDGFVGAIQTTDTVKIPITPVSVLTDYIFTIPFMDVNPSLGANLTLEAGGVSFTDTQILPTDGAATVPGPGTGSSEFIYTITLENVPANTDTACIIMRSNGGASWFIAGYVSAEASCSLVHCPSLALNASPAELCAENSTELTFNFDSIAGNAALYWSNTLLDSATINSPGHGGATFIDSTQTGVVINEIDYIGGENVELWNTSCDTVDVSNWYFCYKFTYDQLSTATISSGDLVLEPGEKVTFSNLPNITMTNSPGSMGLYNTNSFGSAAAMEDYVQWGSGGQDRENVAVTKGIWTAGDFVGAIGAPNTLQYDGYGNHSDDWFFGSPTFGTTNVNTDNPLTTTFNSGALVNNTTAPITYYFYAILTDANCNRNADCQPVAIDSVVVNPIPDVTTTNADICEGLSINLDTLVTNVNNTTMVDTAYFLTMQNAIDSVSAIASVVSPTSTRDYYVRLSTNSNPSCYDIESLTITVNDIISTISTTCSDNGTGGDSNDDTFTITVNATNASPGSSGQYLVIYNGNVLNGSGTNYGSDVTVSHVDFVANGSFSPTLTIRDVDDVGCEIMENVSAVGSCSICPPTICLPVKVIRKGGTN